MIDNKLISLEELVHYGPVANLSEQAVTLVTQQKTTWELAGKNYAGLALAEFKTFDFGHFKIVAQYNPERIRSSAAKTDTRSISERPCFLCPGSLPEEQKGLMILDKYIILVNPYPIFPVHLTISQSEHVPQLISAHFPDLLKISRELEELSLFYNGPECGASAPDHFHFQAVFGGILPVENEFEILRNYHSEILVMNDHLTVISVENYLRRFIAIESDDEAVIIEHFNLIYRLLGKKSTSPEPLMNILCNYLDGHWRVIIFPRERHRPSQYFVTGEQQLLFSPALVELGGLAIFARREDFEKLESILIADMYKQVTIQKEKYLNLLINYVGSEPTSKAKKKTDRK
jgi:hypothetical protein